MGVKTIKSSKRGLTFSLDENDVAIGSHYRYVVDKENMKILILIDDNGTNTVSKKKSGDKVKPLFDIRSKEVKEFIADADYLEIEVKQDKIVVSTYKKTNGNKIVNFHLKKNKTCDISEVFGVKTSEIVIPIGMTVSSDFSYESELNNESINKFLSLFVADGSRRKNVNNEIKKIYDVVSLFSGAGLFDKVWLDDGRFRFVYANDFDESVIDTYKYNIGDHIVCKDIREVQANELPFSDIFVASPCCQAYSNANRRNINSEEGKKKRLLIEDVVRLTKEKRPKVLVVENVPQFITKEKGLHLNKIIEGLSDYEVSIHVVKDNEVGGFSKRKRCIVIASRIGKIELPQVKCLTSKTVRDALNNVDSTWFNYNDVTIPSEVTREKMSYVPQGGNWKDIPPEIGKYGKNTQSNIMRRLKWDEPSITLSNFRKSNILHPEKNRILTVSEAAAIMGLDKHFRFISDSLSAKQQMVANGVTQAIGKFVKNAVLNKLDEYEASLYMA